MKKVITYNDKGLPNGFLLELQKDGEKTTAYLTCVRMSCFKGYHLHKRRIANYVCIQGAVLVITYHKENDKWIRKEKHLIEGDEYQIGINIPTGLSCTGFEDAWIVNFPSPAYDPNDKDEQVEYTQEQLEQEPR